jgi:predicted DNA binding CopG/RHH family protein
MSKRALSAEEQELLKSVEAGDFVSSLTPARREELEAIAGNTFRRDKRINIRISNRDLMAVQSKALQEGVPYQTLVSSIIHKYVSGSLQDVEKAKSKKDGGPSRT